MPPCCELRSDRLRELLRLGLILRVGLVWLLSSAPCVKAACVELHLELPQALQSCVTAAQLCASYQRALADHSNHGASTPMQAWHVDLRGRPHAQNPAFLLEMDAFAAGQLRGRRTLSVHPRDCAALPDTLGLVLVLLGDQQPPLAEVVASGEATAGITPRAGANTTARRHRRPQPPAAPAGQLEVGAGVGAYAGVLPSLASNLRLHAAILHGSIALRVGAVWLSAQTLRIAEGRVQMQDYEISFEVCPGLRLRTRPELVLRMCAGPRLGFIDARARGFTIRNDHVTQFFLYLGLLPEVSVALGATTWLQFHAGTALALARPRFTVGLEGGRRRTTLATFKSLRAEIMLGLVQVF